MKSLLFVLLLFGCGDAPADCKMAAAANRHPGNEAGKEAETRRIKAFGKRAKDWCARHHYNTRFVFLADMALPSGTKRFFVYDMQGDMVVCSSLVAHGCCNRSFLPTVQFSNEPGCGCSSLGKYKIGGKYKGRYGTAYKLTGLDSSNSNAWERNIVLHSYYSVPDEDTEPEPIVNSYDCPMVSGTFLQVLEAKIDASPKPVLLWILK